MAKVIFNGEEGETFVNRTSKVLYQFFCSLDNTCGACLQYHHAISTWWGIPIHRGCRCWQEIVAPDAVATPWVDFREILWNLSPDQQRKAIGASCYRLLDAKVLTWEEIVTQYRVRTLKEIVARQKISVAVMRKAGVMPSIAEEAWGVVNTPEHEVVKAHRKHLVDALEGVGVSVEEIKRTFSEGVAAKIHLTPIEGVVEAEVLEVEEAVSASATGQPGPVRAKAGPKAVRARAAAREPTEEEFEPIVKMLGLDLAKIKAAMRAAKRKPKGEGDR